MPQALAAMSLKMTMPRIIARFGYRRVLLANTLGIGVLIALFATIGEETPVWLIVAEAFCFGFASSLQYTSMNTLTFADVSAAQTSNASTIASTMQQMAISFGVATASLVTAVFIPDTTRTSAPQMIRGIHEGFLALGILTILSTVVFGRLRDDDGDNVSRGKPALPSG